MGFNFNIQILFFVALFLRHLRLNDSIYDLKERQDAIENREIVHTSYIPPKTVLSLIQFSLNGRLIYWNNIDYYRSADGARIVSTLGSRVSTIMSRRRQVLDEARRSGSGTSEEAMETAEIELGLWSQWENVCGPAQ